jgi:hypothetical protein
MNPMVDMQNIVAHIMSERINAILNQSANQRDRLTALVVSFSVEISMIPLQHDATREEVTDQLLALVKDAVMNLEDVN